jgi:superfamily II DNA or RNA helicase
MKKLWKHQEYAISKYKDRPYFGLLFDMGLGKTLTVTRIAEEKDKPVLIIAPNALCSQWEKELTDKGEDRITEKDWEVVLCTSKTKNTRKFKEALDTLCKE